MGALMLTATDATALSELPVRTGRSSAAVLRNCSVLEVAAGEVALEITEAGASLPSEASPPASFVSWMRVPADPIAASHTETLDSLTRRVDAGFVAARRSGAFVTLARVAFGKSEPPWGWAGRRTFIEAIVRRAADQLVERYEVVVCVPEPPQSEAGARAFDLFDQLMHVVDPRGMLRLQFAH